MNRKTFFKQCGFLCLGSSVMVGLLNGCSSTNYYAQHQINNNKITISKLEFINQAKNKTTERKFIIVKSNQINFPICIFKLPNNLYSAVLMECSHNSCELQNNGDFLICPCHGSEFSSHGVVQNPPADQNLKTYLTTTDNENIYIYL